MLELDGTMKDLKISFNGDASTIKLNETVDDKNLYEQKVLINLVTARGSDRVFPSRGTKLLADSIYGRVYSKTGAAHVGNFAALDTIYFIRSTDPKDIQNADYLINDVNVYTISYNNQEHVLNMSVQVVYKDNTSTEVVAELPTLS